MVQMRGANQSSSGDTEWIPAPEGTYRVIVGKPVLVESSFKDKDGNPKWNVRFPLQLTDAEYARAKDEAELGEGQQLSGRTSYRVGLSLGWFPDGKYKSTRLVDFLTFLLGKSGRELRKWIEAGGGGGLEAEDFLGWFEGAEVWGKISHRPDSVTPGKVWADFVPVAAVGDMPGERDDQYQAWARGRLKQLTAGHLAGPTDIEVRYDEQGREVRTVHKPSGPAAEQGIAEGTAAKAEREAEQPELVAAAGAPAKQPRSYEEIFNDE